MRADISCFDVTESLILIHPTVDIGLTKFTSGLTSLSGVALRFSGEMLREFSKLPKKKKKKKNCDFTDCGIHSGNLPYKGAHHTICSHMPSPFYPSFA